MSRALEGADVCYREGYEAAGGEKSYRDYCPYTFKVVGVSQEEYERVYRPKMEAWFRGWKAYLDEHDMGYNFKPKRKAH